MCGLSGEIRFDGGRPDLAAVERMTDRLAPRGPDGRGLWSQGSVALGHRRLKIIDLSECGAQPMTDPAARIAGVFNGCVYNYKELREELRGLGHRFFSGSDTEVVLKAYQQWGTACVDRFYGMFAFVIVEQATGRVVLARDRLGVKPLYLAEAPGRLRFASSLPALLAGGGVDTSLDPVALHQYMSWHATVAAPRTVLAGVRKLPAGHRARRGAGRPPPRHPLLAAAVHPSARVRSTWARTTGGTRCWTRCAPPYAGAWSPTYPWASCCRAASTPA